MVRIAQGIFLSLLLMFLGFCAGGFAGSFFVPAGSGLSGPPVALAYGLAGSIIGLVTGVVLARNMRPVILRNLLVVAGIVSLIMCGVIIYRIRAVRHQQTGTEKLNSFFHKAGFYETDAQLPLGVGIARPYLIPGRTLYFYSYIPLGASHDQLKPIDSVTFVKESHFIGIATAPPWLVPEFLKLDYDIFFLRAVTLSKDWVEVIVNNKTGQTGWIEANAADFLDWQRFLLGVAGVEVIEPVSNPVRLKPLDHAAILAEPPLHFDMRPLAIKGEWIMVSTLGLADRIEPAGWIRWRNGDRLLIRFSPLS